MRDANVSSNTIVALRSAKVRLINAPFAEQKATMFRSPYTWNSFQSSVRKNRAFTLVEMIVALVLGTLLLATLMGVLRRSFVEISTTRQDDPSIHRMGLLADQLRRDLSNARNISVGNNRFELLGFGHRDPQTLTATLRPARVSYEIRQDGKRSLLVRVQSDIAGGMASSGIPFIEPVYFGAAKLLLTSNEVKGFPKLDEVGTNVLQESTIARNRWAVPSSVQIVILDQRDRLILDQTFTHERDTR